MTIDSIYVYTILFFLRSFWTINLKNKGEHELIVLYLDKLNYKNDINNESWVTNGN